MPLIIGYMIGKFIGNMIVAIVRLLISFIVLCYRFILVPCCKGIVILSKELWLLFRKYAIA